VTLEWLHPNLYLRFVGTDPNKVLVLPVVLVESFQVETNQQDNINANGPALFLSQLIEGVTLQTVQVNAAEHPFVQKPSMSSFIKAVLLIAFCL
jgi:hypothetical protein